MTIDMLGLVLFVVLIAIPVYLCGSILAYFMLWWFMGKHPKPVLRKLFWE